MKHDDLILLQAVFDSSEDGMLIFNSVGQVTHYNARFQEIWKIPLHIYETRDDEKILECILEQLIDPEQFLNKARESYEMEAISKDNIEFKDGRFFELQSRLLILNNHKHVRIWSFKDITEQKKAQATFSAITNLVPDIISIINSSGELVFNSQASERIHGYGRDELIGKNTFNFIHQDDQTEVANVMAELLANPRGNTSVQYRYKNKNDTYSWMEATASNQIDNPQISGLVVISREISKRKKLEEDLSSALKLRDEFISITTHELKTPLTSIKLQLQMLQRSNKRLIDEIPSTRSENLTALIDQVTFLQRLIDDLLNVTKMRTGKLSYQKRDDNLSLIVKETLEQFTEMMKHEGCTLETNLFPDIIISCDKLRIQQLIVNIMSNAIKYAPGSLIEVSLRPNAGFVELKIKDNGPGIPADKHECIFKLFERATECQFVSGLGIGLYVSKGIVDQHGGTIHVESAHYEGAAFIIRFPLKFF